MPADKLYCPEFVYQICVGLTVYDFVTKEFTLPMVSKQYATGITDHYNEVLPEELSYPAEEILRFMSEQQKPKYEAHEKANFFVYNQLKFDGTKGERKLKGIFGNAFTGEKTKKYNAEKTVKVFKAFTFSLRSGAVDRAPAGWMIKSENKDELMQLGQIITKEMKIDDLL